MEVSLYHVILVQSTINFNILRFTIYICFSYKVYNETFNSRLNSYSEEKVIPAQLTTPVLKRILTFLCVGILGGKSRSKNKMKKKYHTVRTVTNSSINISKGGKLDTSDMTVHSPDLVQAQKRRHDYYKLKMSMNISDNP